MRLNRSDSPGVLATCQRTRWLIAGSLFTLVVLMLLAGCTSGAEEQAAPTDEPVTEPAAVNEAETVATSTAITFDNAVSEPAYVVRTASLSAVGDNLMNMPVIESADRAEGGMGDGLYNFESCYEGLRDIVATHDINFIAIETILGGDEKGITGYPVFNTPTDDATDLVNFGFNLGTTATNHSLDLGFAGIEGSSATWAAHPEMVVTGTFVNEEDRHSIRTFECNDLTIAFLGYTDSLNDIPLPEDKPWAVATDDREAIRQDLAQARAMADVVIVAMSWGDEYAHEPNARQRETAQLLADGGADLVLGFGPHVIQPVEWVEGHDDVGAPNGRRTLVVYSLGNFVSNQQDTFANVGGCFTCDLSVANVASGTGEVTILNPTWTILINHFSGRAGHTVYQLKHYTVELARAHDVLRTLDDPLGYARTLTANVIDPAVVTIE